MAWRFMSSQDLTSRGAVTSITGSGTMNDVAVGSNSSSSLGWVRFSASASPTGAAKIVVDSGLNQTGAAGEVLPLPFVAVVVDGADNRLAGVPVTFAVVRGGGTLSGAAAKMNSAAGMLLSGARDGRPLRAAPALDEPPTGADSVTMPTDGDGRAAAFLQLGPDEGRVNNVVQATFEGNPGAPAIFPASGLVAGNPAQTSVTGVVLDNSNLPIPGVTMRLLALSQGTTGNVPVEVVPPVTTGAQGQFTITQAPVGIFKLMADGATAAVEGKRYPTLEFDVTTVAGRSTTIGMPMYLQALDTANQLCVSETAGGTLTLPAFPGFSLTVGPGSATFAGGSRAGCLTATVVNPDKVPMAPDFGKQPRFVLTIQPVGTLFNPPAPVTLPNVDGLPPRTVVEMSSYDHDLAAFVVIGTGTVSADGSLVVSDPGVGVLKSGWFFGCPSGNSGGACHCDDCNWCIAGTCMANPSANCRTCRGGVCSSGKCVAAVTLRDLQFNRPSADGKPGSEISFVSTDVVSFTPRLTPHCPSTQLAWQSDNTAANGDLNQPSVTESMYFAVPRPPLSSNARPAPLTYTVTATLNADSRHFTIRQDEVDRLRQQYIDMQKTTVPARATFINSGSSPQGNVQFTQIKSPDSDWAIFSIFGQMDTWQSNYGGPLGISRGYSTPAHNDTVAGAATNSQHIYGNAADVASGATTWAALRQAARDGGACTEPLSISGSGHVHADWRGACPPGW
jgi:hypothetical protein